MRKKILEQKLARLEAKKTALAERCKASEDVNEIRGLTDLLEDVKAEIEETRSEIEAIDAETRELPPQGAELKNADVVGSFHTEEREADTDMEYRKAFMAYLQTGEVRDAITLSDTGAAVPVTVMNEVINTVRKRYGNLYNKVRKMNVKGGVEFAVGALQATFKWINESTVSPRQDLGKLGKVSFKYYEAEIRIAQSFLSSIVTLEAFEAEIARCIAIAYLQAMDEGIVNGTGDGMMTGILHDARVTNVVEMTAAEMADWKKWRTKFFSRLPLGYRDGEFIFPLSTVETYLETMSDANGNPIFRQATGLDVNDGDAMNPNGRFFGREISLVEPTILPDYDTAEVGDVIGIYWQPNEYAINENFGFTMLRYFDHEANQYVDKAICIVDGKILNPTGYVLLKKKA